MNDFKVGDRVVITKDYYGQRNGSIIGRIGTIRKYGPNTGGNTLCWDVELDVPLRDGRTNLWFSTKELT
jgi:hypothetical protein